MIVGLGTDMIDNRRIKRLLNLYGHKFKNRCFSKNEIQVSESKYNEINSFAKRYAAKEAFAKALGIGFAKGVFLKDIEVMNDKYGKPFILLYNKTLAEFNNLSIIKLPPYSPQLNPIEKVWSWLRQHHLANRCFSGYNDIVDSITDAWNAFCASSKRVKSISYMKWLNQAIYLS